MRSLILTLLLLSTQAPAQTPSTSDGRRWEAAPTGGPLSNGVAPADRAGAGGGRDATAGPANSTPFSGAPTGLGGGGGEASSANRDGSSSGDVPTPYLGR